MRPPTREDREIAQRIFAVALNQSNSDKLLIFGQKTKQNRLAERLRTQQECPFIRNSKGFLLIFDRQAS